MQEGTALANFLPIGVQIRRDQAAVDLMDSLDQLGQMHFDAARLAQGVAGRSPARPLHAAAANLLANLVQILLEFGFGDHDSSPDGSCFPLAGRIQREPSGQKTTAIVLSISHAAASCLARYPGMAWSFGKIQVSQAEKEERCPKRYPKP